MPVTITNPSFGADRSQCAKGCINPSAECIERRSRTLCIGLINNMPDGALEPTEQQFVSLLNAASGEFAVNLSFYSLPGIPRGTSARHHLDQHYRSTDSLWNTKLDALIVTGKEPVAHNLQDEPFWESFVSVLEWARENTCSTIWSCLAAHAAVLHMDGIQRVRNSHKCSGIIDCSRVVEHPITANLPDRYRLPHSRWNGLQESDLTRSGYQILTRTENAGIDCFTKQEQSLFLFFQGHPEYQRGTLLLEYRRDVVRYLRGESAAYPNIPEGYFDQRTLCELMDVQHKAETHPHEETLARLEILLSPRDVEDGWHATAATFYKNWLQYISTEKKARMQKKRGETGIAAQVLSPVLFDPAALVTR